jgi:SAM-dependent methyltransferase
MITIEQNPANPLFRQGPCGEPCEHPCDDHEPDSPVAQASEPALFRWLKAGLFNTLDLCFDDVYREPKRILIVGGCRQIPLAQHLALLLPAAEITLVDSDETVVTEAKEAICCRFKFIHAPLEQLPFEENAFDFTVAHNFLAYPSDWQRALSELGRVTDTNLLISAHRPLLWKVASRFDGFRTAIEALGLPHPTRKLPENVDWLTHVNLYAKIKTRLSPMPWTVYMTEIRPQQQERLILQ